MNLNDNSNLSAAQEKASDTVEVTLTMEGVTKQVQWNRQIPLLDALLNAGIDAPHSCCRGNCGTCVCKLEEGEVRLRRNFVLSEAHIQQGLILACVAAPISSSIKINYDNF
ncbi:2Fe-2S iron-sulfur cluster-binding protein [Elizabethkingia meningoseptica]|uniref:2Fe-2S iron-sulfur cluster-binding protein n=1 Tax=Elizabethkingia meningoseptica TaxID=238 RepID=UPI0023AFA094|nr:2Fe-2S iron-sulfur cluster binding domain-containing protein [Elizabethkingia meningoseptica]MDE5492556.1 2Fe-2S iron-sulfur cluster binding domain-containing protein [Elizabethkingia meningoseptica]